MAVAATGYTPTDVRGLTFHDAARRFADGTDTPRAYLERCLETIAAREPVVRAFAALNEAGAREAADACGRLVERPVQRGLSQAALETLAIVAYLGPVSRPEIARIRGVAADSAVAGLVERGLIADMEIAA